jgi:hypothetical protein
MPETTTYRELVRNITYAESLLAALMHHGSLRHGPRL